MAYPNWFLPVTPVYIDRVKEYVNDRYPNVVVEMTRNNQNQPLSDQEIRKALYKIYVEKVVLMVKTHLDRTLRDHDDSLKFIGEQPYRLTVGKSFLCAKTGEQFTKNNPETWDMNIKGKGIGSCWDQTYSSHMGRLLGYKRMMAVVVITDDDLPGYILNNHRLHKSHSRDSLASAIVDALGRPRDAQGNLMRRPEDRTLMGCPLDNDPDEIKGNESAGGGGAGGQGLGGKQGGQAWGHFGAEGDASVVYVVYRPDLRQINSDLQQMVNYYLSQWIPLQEPNPGSFKCREKGCYFYCVYMVNATSFRSRHTGISYKIYHHIDCNTKNVIYLITCNKTNCGKQYVGYTARKLKTKISEHCKKSASLYVDKHFRTPDHSIENITVTGIEHVEQVETTLPERRNFWIKELQTKDPDGLNKTS